MKKSDRCTTSNNIIDLLHTRPSNTSFSYRVTDLGLSRSLNEKIHGHLDTSLPSRPETPAAVLSEENEKELALEVLLARHRFTELIFSTRSFRQAALTIIQNIYLFRNRRIFFSSDLSSTELERQEALRLLSAPRKSVPLARTFQHLIIARVWNRINGCRRDGSTADQAFERLHEQVEKLNTLRNIYMILSTGLVHTLARKTSRIYRQSLPYEDAVQAGCFGIARAAYRYHPSCGVRFSTYAANWIKKEIQRQGLACRLVRVSSNIVEKYSEAVRTGNIPALEKLSAVIGDAPAFSALNAVPEGSLKVTPADIAEKRQMTALLHHLVDTALPVKSSDVIKRRFGLPPYFSEQSIIEISRVYGVSRSSIYQLEQRAKKVLADRLQQCTMCPV